MNQEPESVHTPVLQSQVLRALESALGKGAEGWLVDGTVGAAGHATRILETFPGIRVLGLDQDPEILSRAERRLAPYGTRALLRHGRLSSLARILEEEQVEPLALLIDLGVSSLQLDDPGRGFSFLSDGPLDMRMDPERRRTAADIVNRWDEADLADLFFYEGDEKRARRIARAIVLERRRAPFTRTLMLADLVARAVGSGGGGGGGGRGRGRIHPATRTFQALRRAVNEEGEELIAALEGAAEWLAPGGVLIAISFHSGEDRVVKHFLRDGAREGTWELLSRKPLVADEAELAANPRSRSAKLRAAVRPGDPDRRADPGRQADPGRDAPLGGAE